MKRKVAVLLILSVIICTLCGCKVDLNKYSGTNIQGTSEVSILDDVTCEGFEEVDRDLFSVSSDFETKPLRVGYESLSREEMKECYNRIDESVFFVSAQDSDGYYKTRKVTLQNVTLSEAELRVIIAAYFGDNPQIFWLDNNFEYASNEKKTVLQFTSFLSASEIEEDAEKLRDVTDQIMNGISSDFSEYDRELYLHDVLIESCEYDEEVSSIEDNFRAFTVVGALLDKSAVCEGYSRAYQYLLSVAGIESYCVLGTGEDELHMWNAVSICDNWYYVDTTWDEDEDGGVCYDYFNMSSEQIEASHIVNDDFTVFSDEEICGDEYTPPQSFNIASFDCNDESLSYHMQNGLCIDGIGAGNKERLTQEIVRKAEEAEGEKFTLYLWIDTDYLDYDYAVNNIFYSGEYLIFHAIDSANYRMYKTVDRDSVSIRKIPELSAVNVYLTLE